MHEMGIMAGVLDSVCAAAKDAGATKVTSVSLSIGRMTEAIEDVLVFAWEALSEGTMCEGATLQVTMVEPRSRCLECGHEFEHDRFHRTCPVCDNPLTELIAGREMQLDSIEVDLPDDEGETAAGAGE
jgi:hydrogenase nickel incorporation protein HypA/HybF